jgi:putative transposase
VVRDRDNWLKAQPVLTRTNGAELVKPTSYEVMKIKAVNHKPMIHFEGTHPTGWRGGQLPINEL